LNDALPCNPSKLQIRPEWTLTAEMREKALAKWHLATKTQLLSKSKPLKPLELNCVVQVQNQRGTHGNKWDLSGTIVEVQPFDAYLVKMDGTGRITKRNRIFLRPILPFSDVNAPKLPLQNFKQTLIRETPAIAAADDDNDLHNANSTFSNSGPSADKAGRPSSAQRQHTTEPQQAAGQKVSSCPSTSTRHSRSNRQNVRR
jgi:hypothetical protein